MGLLNGPNNQPRKAMGALGIMAILAGAATFNPFLMAAGAAGLTVSSYGME